MFGMLLKIKNISHKILLVVACLHLNACTETPTFNLLPMIASLWEEEPENADKPDLKAQKTEIIGEADSKPQLQVDSTALSDNIIPSPKIVHEWPNEMAEFSGNIKGSSLTEVVDSAAIGEGYDWAENAIAPSVVIAGDMAVAMDGRGYISAHNLKDPSEILWQNEAVATEQDLVTGGLAISEGRIFAVSSYGKLAAINAKDGKTKWQQNLHEAVRSSLRVDNDKLLVVTADSQLLCFDKQYGAPLWQHRAIAQNSGVLGTSMPIVTANAVVVSFPSGDLSALNPANGETLWSDSLHKTEANGKLSALFSGVDSNPIADDNLLITGNLEDLTMAHNGLTGARVWELKTGLAHNPWIAGDGLFAINNHGEMLAIHKYRGVVAWQSKFATSEGRKYYGAFMLNGKLIALISEGEVFAFAPDSGKKLWMKELGYEIAASPAFAGDKAALVTKDAQILIVK
jgi:outer membrane protein assembly factor BamB